MEKTLPSIPAKRYFTIGEVSELCGVKPHVLRYWEQEFTQLRPMKRRGNRRYYQHREVLMIRRIRELLHDQGFTIVGARNKLHEVIQSEGEGERRRNGAVMRDVLEARESDDSVGNGLLEATEFPDFPCTPARAPNDAVHAMVSVQHLLAVRQELHEIRELLNTNL